MSNELQTDSAPSFADSADSALFKSDYNLGDRFKFEDVLGRGAMSVVVRAHDNLLSRPVAIKLLSEELLGHEEAQQIFLTEARSLATLSHPNLVSVHDITRVDGRVLLVLELVKGENLERLVHDAGGLPIQEALRACIQLVRVVTYLHDCGIVHRDLKPANVMIRNDGTLKLIDFGLARFFHELYVRQTRVRGTPAYMAPEQIAGGDITPAVDLYALGVTMFEIFSGDLPFSEGDISYAHVHRSAPSLAEYCPDLPPRLVAAIDQCLEKDPGDRPMNGEVLLQAMQDIYQELGGDDIETDVSALMSRELVASSAMRRASGALSSISRISATSSEWNTSGSMRLQVPHEETLAQKLTSPRVLLVAILLLLVAAIGGLYVKLGTDGDDTASTDTATAAESPAEADTEPAAPEAAAPAAAPAAPEPAAVAEQPYVPNSGFTFSAYIAKRFARGAVVAALTPRVDRADPEPVVAEPSGSKTRPSTSSSRRTKSSSKRSTRKKEAEQVAAPAPGDTPPATATDTSTSEPTARQKDPAKNETDTGSKKREKADDLIFGPGKKSGETGGGLLPM